MTYLFNVGSCLGLFLGATAARADDVKLDFSDPRGSPMCRGLPEPEKKDFHVEGLELSSFQAKRLISADSEGVVFETTEGQREVRWDELSRIVFSWWERPPAGPMTFALHPQGRIFGEIVDSFEEGVIVYSLFAERSVLPFAQLAGICFTDIKGFAKSNELFRKALEERLVGKDVLITRSTTDVRTMRGRLDSLSVYEGVFSLGDKARSFDVDKAYGIVFASGLENASKHRLICRLNDGSFFQATPVRANGDSVTLSTSLGSEFTLPVSTIAVLDIISARVKYLGDLKPIAESTEGILQTPWSACFGCNVAGEPIRMLQKEYARGIGVHSRSELTFEVDGGYESFAATIGIDDSVRPRGNVVFRIVGQRAVSKTSNPRKSGAGSVTEEVGNRLPALFPEEKEEGKPSVESPELDAPKVLFDSGAVTGLDSPRDISVPVVGVVRLTLVVDYGDELDWSDRANWANARLLRPASTVTRP
ncbi:MAG: NPCBM/NEW2 domain-containing protein [Planctomycetota bacterium]